MTFQNIYIVFDENRQDILSMSAIKYTYWNPGNVSKFTENVIILTSIYNYL